MIEKRKAVTCTLRGTESPYTVFLKDQKEYLPSADLPSDGTMNYDGQSCIIINIDVMSLKGEEP